MRRWGTKLAVAVDLPFFEAIGGPSDVVSKDINDGDIVWMVACIDSDFSLVPHDWEVLSLETSCEKLISAETVKRHEFESVLRRKLYPIALSRPARDILRVSASLDCCLVRHRPAGHTPKEHQNRGSVRFCRIVTIRSPTAATDD